MKNVILSGWKVIEVIVYSYEGDAHNYCSETRCVASLFGRSGTQKDEMNVEWSKPRNSKGYSSECVLLLCIIVCSFRKREI